MLGITVGVAALVIVLGVMTGFNEVIRERHLRVEPHLVTFPAEDADGKAWKENAAQIAQKTLAGEISEVAPFSTQDVILKTVDGYFAGAIAKGMEKDGLISFVSRSRMPDSRTAKRAAVEVAPLIPEEWQLGENEVLIGSELFDALRLIEGDKLVLIAPEALLLPADEAPPMQTVTVRGTFSAQLADVDGKLVLFDEAKSLKALGNTASRELGLEIRLKKGEQFEKPQAKLKALGWSVFSWPERNAAMFFALKMEKLAMTIFLGLSALITGFSILTVLILLVTQKRREIGILMAMGLTGARTQKAFAGVGMWLSMTGVLLGLALGSVVCWVVDSVPLSILPVIYYDRTIPADVSPTLLMVIMGAALVLSCLGSWFPAHFSARLHPAESLRAD